VFIWRYGVDGVKRVFIRLVGGTTSIYMVGGMAKVYTLLGVLQVGGMASVYTIGRWHYEYLCGMMNVYTSTFW